MNKHISMISLGLMISGIYATGVAQPPLPPNFTEMDKDGDNRVSEQELTDFRAKRMEQRAAEGRPMLNASKAPSFSKIDTNGDKYLSIEEFRAHHIKMMQQRNKKGNCKHPKFELLDTNGDGSIQRTEFDNFHVRQATPLPKDAVKATTMPPTTTQSPVNSAAPTSTDTPSASPNSK